MKFIYIMLLLFSLPSWSNSQGILRCLGLEEAKLHENKVSGPLYNLNQKLISELVQIPGVRINQVDYRRICGQGNESLKLLEQILIQGKSLFINTQQGMQKTITQEMIDDFTILSKEIFLNFLAQVQMISPTPHCLNEHIPALPKLMEQIKYLEDEVDIQKIFGKKDLAIFRQLQDYPLYFKACEKSKNTEISGSKTSK
ncbi:MAG TPA: hypothetical protein VKZ84_06795 [Bacteriovoracaceae bacterium]|nr:hypothetical protein [Bacteriovoracaceae bacterium]